MKTTTTLALFALALLATPQFALAQGRKKEGDKIFFKDGTEKTDCNVSVEKWEEVKYRYKRKTESTTGDKILEIVHGDAPRAYNAGESQRRGAQYEKAITSYTAALEDATAKPWVKIYAQFFLGESLRLFGKSEDAIAAYKVAAANKDHLIYPRIQIGLGRAHADAKQWSDAIDALTAVSEGRYGYWRTRADLAIGDVNLLKGDMTQARRFYKRVQDQNDDESMKVAGTVGEGNTYLAEKNFSKARDFFKGITRRTDLPRDVAAGAWAGIGDCEMERAKEGKKGAEEAALLSYLRVVVQFAGSGDAYAKALSQAAKLYDKFKMPAKAESLRRELKNRCPTSSYAKELAGGK